MDYGSFDDLSLRQRAAYVRQIVPRAKRGGKFLLWCFEWEPRPWERAATAILPFGNLTLRPGEVHRWFADAFDIEQVAGRTGLASWPRGLGGLPDDPPLSASGPTQLPHSGIDVRERRCSR